MDQMTMKFVPQLLNEEQKENHINACHVNFTLCSPCMPCCSTSSLLRDVFIFSRQMTALKQRSFNDITMIQTELGDVLAKFQTVNWWRDHWIHCIKSQGDYFDDNSIDQKVSVVGEK
jgi:hypothetical protein